MVPAALIARDLAFGINDLPATITWNGKPYRVSSTDVESAQEISIDGVVIMPDAAFTCRIADFPDGQPSNNSRITKGVNTLVVLRKTPSEDGISFILYCKGNVR